MNANHSNMSKRKADDELLSYKNNEKKEIRLNDVKSKHLSSPNIADSDFKSRPCTLHVSRNENSANKVTQHQNEFAIKKNAKSRTIVVSKTQHTNDKTVELSGLISNNSSTETSQSIKFLTVSTKTSHMITQLTNNDSPSEGFTHVLNKTSIGGLSGIKYPPSRSTGTFFERQSRTSISHDGIESEIFSVDSNSLSQNAPWPGQATKNMIPLLQYQLPRGSNLKSRTIVVSNFQDQNNIIIPKNDQISNNAATQMPKSMEFVTISSKESHLIRKLPEKNSSAVAETTKTATASMLPIRFLNVPESKLDVNSSKVVTYPSVQILQSNCHPKIENLRNRAKKNNRNIVVFNGTGSVPKETETALDDSSNDVFASVNYETISHVNNSNYNNAPSPNVEVLDYREKNVFISPVTDNVQEHYIGAMDDLCCHCQAKHFKEERTHSNKPRANSFQDCCSHGEVDLQPLPQPPPILRHLFDGTHPESTHFYEHIRYYNNSFSFASFNANLCNFSNRRPGPYCFKIQGQIYYQMNTALYPDVGELPRYGQLFIYDGNCATDFRCQFTPQVKRDLVKEIENSIRQCNMFAQSYEMMRQELLSMRAANGDTEPELMLLFSLKPGTDQRRYNFQRSNEVAAVFSTTADGGIPEAYVTVRNKQTKELQFVSSLDPNVEPWIYPLFYPYGTPGWSISMKQCHSNKRISRNAYVRYRMADRPDNVIIRGRRLFQQWIVDSYVKVEEDRINYIKSNQQKCRVDSYAGLMDHLQKRANESNTTVGRVVILPSSFVGSPRNMLQHYQDAMAIVSKYGKPDLFITMTCNPMWREIQEHLLPGQSASDRPDLVARVFDLKKNELINLIFKKKIFGEALSYVYVVEYQKRGLPHVHLLVTLKQNSKITTPDIVDRYISAEIPDEIESEKLHSIVMKNMIHGPCGDWCLKDGRCSKRFPKAFVEKTTMDENGYPNYQRRNTGKTFCRGQSNFVFDNQYVVPYSPYLLLYFNCHINVEIVSDIKAVKYLYKYVFKGHDMFSGTIENVNSTDQIQDYDECKNFIEARYVSPVEAAGRILSKTLQAKSHSILRLPVHLENQQTITFDDGDDINDAIGKKSMLVDYFALNQRDVSAKQYIYPEIPTKYTFYKGYWNLRKSNFNALGRMYSVSPTQTELYHLRLLLIHVRGPISFSDLRIVDGVTYDTYVAACLARGLIEDDQEWMRAMHEAEVWMMPRQLRELFVRILIFCQPIYPDKLWEDFQDAMSEDFSRTLPIEAARKKAYIQINTMLVRDGFNLSQYPSMPQISEVEEAIPEIPLNEHNRIGQNQYLKLNDQQKKVVDTIMENINCNAGSEMISCFACGFGNSHAKLMRTNWESTVWYTT